MDPLPRSLALMERSDTELAAIIAQAVTDSQARRGEIWYLRCPKKGKISNGGGSSPHLSRVHSTEVRRLAQAVTFFPYWRAMLNSYPGINCTLQSFDGVTGNPIPFLEEYYDLGIDCVSEFGQVYHLPPPIVVGVLSQHPEPEPLKEWPALAITEDRTPEQKYRDGDGPRPNAITPPPR